jgi:hypothetical protein
MYLKSRVTGCNQTKIIKLDKLCASTVVTNETIGIISLLSQESLNCLMFLHIIFICKYNVALCFVMKHCPCSFFNQAPCHEGVLGEWRYSSTHSLTSALDGGEWSASHLSCFIPRERAPGTH